MNKSIKLPFNLTTEELALINLRLEEFQKLNKENSWFSELCFCLLTANAQAARAIAIQDKLGLSGFLETTQIELAEIIRSHGHRFHNNKSKYIVAARSYKDIKNIIYSMNGKLAREYLVKNIKGLGYKEASHFLRNVGYNDVAIIDRHILRFLANNNYISQIPKVITKKIYLEFEQVLENFNMPLDLLDLMIWCHMTKKVLK